MAAERCARETAQPSSAAPLLFPSLGLLDVSALRNSSLQLSEFCLVFLSLILFLIFLLIMFLLIFNPNISASSRFVPDTAGTPFCPGLGKISPDFSAEIPAVPVHLHIAGQNAEPPYGRSLVPRGE